MNQDTLALTIASLTICFRRKNITWSYHNINGTSIDFTTIFLVQHRESVVFFVDIKAAGHIDKSTPRAAADKQMRERADDLRDDVEIPILYGVSAIGTKLCFYKYTKDTQELEPAPIPGHATRVVDTAPRDHWDFDVLTPEGECHEPSP